MKTCSLRFSQFCILVTVVMSVNVMAAKFEGYDRGPNTQAMIFIDSVARVKEREADFLILFAHHAAFYRFPKSNNYVAQVREFISARIKTQNPITVAFDPVTGQILYIEDAPAPPIKKEN